MRFNQTSLEPEIFENNCIPFGIIKNMILCFAGYFTGLHLECEGLPVFEGKVFPLILTAYFGDLPLVIDDAILNNCLKFNNL